MFKTNRTVGIIVFVFLALGMAGCGDRGSSSEQTSTTTDDLYFAEVSGTETPIVAIVADKSGAETLAILAEKDAEGNPVRITGAAYSSEEGYSGTIEVGTDGLPTTLTDSSGSTVTFTNYTESTVDISVYDSSGNLVAGPVTTNIDAGKIQEIKEMFGLISFSATSKSEKVSRRGAIFQETSGGWWAEWGGTVWSWAGCTISGTSAILSGGVAIPIAALSCGSALFDTIAGFTENEIDDVVSLSIGSASCIAGADVFDCMSVLTDIMAGNYIVDTTPPTISTISPTNNTTDISINNSVTATFSEAIDASTLTTETFTLKQGTTAISGTVTYAGTTATFTPSSDLNYSTTYTANISTGVKDSAGNAMANNYSWAFTTVASSDTGSVPSAPSGVSATAGDGQVSITWDSVSGATSYNIYWSTTSGVSKSNGTKLSNVTSPYTHTGLTNGTTYYYVVTAVNSYGESSESSEVSASPNATPAATGRMPDTNQTTSYTNTFGEDHDYTINPPSYTDNGDSTITDNVTGLVWQKQDDATKRTWADAGTYCDASTLGGYSDWRLPSQIELISIIDNGVYNPSINTTFFPGTASSLYWSSTTYASNASYAWHVYFYFGNLSLSLKSDSFYVRCVRGGQTTSNLTDNGNGTVTDSGTLLIWQQGENSAMTWEAALSYCEGLSLAGSTDWRLPNHKELLSLVDYTRFNPAINTTLFPSAVSSDYWSSTTVAYSTSGAWGVNFGSGGSYGGYKTYSNYVRCVRGGE